MADNPDKANKANVSKSGRASEPTLKRKAAEVLKSMIPKRLKKPKSTTPKDKPPKKSKHTKEPEEVQEEPPIAPSGAAAAPSEPRQRQHPESEE
ncbi:hypothetical protein GALMADRAFT_136186 [Galerina marginata CBS 339.88]|uniref:Uncharacterized protein n=1 Tax=Galerina marginata (strain CBS 339.88) TaxID=685588 RepID=A0A067TMJ7_GALM3|nr:hypothetical protein GALMADRAFT_136186 [Galerina marginata CBS 339.88]